MEPVNPIPSITTQSKLQTITQFLQKPWLKNIAVFTFCLLSVVCFELLFKKELFQASIRLIEIIQDTTLSQRTSFRDYFSTFHMLGDSPTFVVFLASMFPFLSRQDAFYYSFCFGFAIFLRCCFKMFFRDPRPFMYSLNVYPNTCDLTYGTPDCEILLTTLMIGVLFLNRTRQAST